MAEADPQIDLSILVATWNRGNAISETLASFEGLNASGIRWEVIVIDNASTDNTGETLKSFTDRLPLVALHEPEQGKNRALKRGMGNARGDLFVFTDDDVIADPKWIFEFHQAAKRWPQDNIFAGRIIPRYPEYTPAWIHNLDRRKRIVSFGEYHPQSVEGPVPNSPAGGNMAIRRKIFDEFQFSERIGPNGKQYAMGSESELLIRLQEAGNRFIYVPTAKVDHLIREDQVTLKWLFGRAQRMGRGGRRLGGAGGPLPWLRFWGIKWTGIARMLVFLIPYLLTLPLPARFRMTPGWNWNLAIGQIHEDRIMYREKNESRES